MLRLWFVLEVLVIFIMCMIFIPSSCNDIQNVLNSPYQTVHTKINKPHKLIGK